MVSFKYIKYKNLLSYGNSFTTVNFNKGNTLIVGENGDGKSAILDSLFFALFGKSIRKGNNDSLVNRRNKKDLVVHCEFEINGTSYTIYRGLKPKIFKIFIDGEERKSDASVYDTQEYVEHVLGMNQDSFRQIVMLAITDFTPFMKLNPSQRRKVIEQILDIEIFGELNKLIRGDFSEVKKQLNYIDHEIDLIKNSMNINLRHLKEQQDHNEENNSQILAQISKCEDQLVELGANNDFLHNEMASSKNTDHVDYLKDLFNKTEMRKHHLSKDITNLECLDAECPVCFSPIEENYKETLLSDKRSKYEELGKNILSMKGMLDEIITEHNRKLHIQRNIEGNTKFIETILDKIEKLSTNSPKNLDNQRLVLEIKELREKLITLENDKRSMYREKESLQVLDTMLCDNGVKKNIIKKYLPYLNQRVNIYLQHFDFPIKLELDELFDETITLNGRETNGYKGFSEGEKLRIDLSLLFSLRDLAKEKNCVSTNLLIMDEMDFSLDSVGLRSLMDILLMGKGTISTFVITHKAEMKNEFSEEFDEILTVEKTSSGFSEIILI